MEKQNGEVKQLPTIMIGWDEEAQVVRLHFQPEQFQKWEFVLAILDMARREAEGQLALGRAQAVGQLMQQAQQDAAVKQQILRGR